MQNQTVLLCESRIYSQQMKIIYLEGSLKFLKQCDQRNSSSTTNLISIIHSAIHCQYPFYPVQCHRDLSPLQMFVDDRQKYALDCQSITEH